MTVFRPLSHHHTKPAAAAGRYSQKPVVPEVECFCRPAAKESLSSSDCALIGIPADLPALISQQRLYVAEFKPRTSSQIQLLASAPVAKKGSEVMSKKDCGRPQNIPFAG